MAAVAMGKSMLDVATHSREGAAAAGPLALMLVLWSEKLMLMPRSF